MGICWSEPPPPVQQAPVSYPLQPCRHCGAWSKVGICERCLQRNAQPSAPPYAQYPPQQYTYTYAQQPQQMMYYQPPLQYQQQQQQQQRQMGTGTAIATGFVVGALMEDILDPTE